MIQLDLSQYDELDFLTGVSALWVHAEENLNVALNSVKAFTWRDAYVTEDEERTNVRALQLGHYLVYSAKTHFNAVHLTNDDVVPLPVIAKPTIPDSMLVTVKEIES